MKDLFRLGTVCVAAILFAGLSHADSITTYTFTDNCCDDGGGPGSGTGTLVLQNYTLGDQLQTSNFVSFSYSSFFGSFSNDVLNSTGSLSGTLPASLPGPANLEIDGLVPPSCLSCPGLDFLSETTNDDAFSLGTPSEIGTGSALDFGSDGIWSAAAPNNAVPEPSLLVMLTAGLAGLLAWRARFSRKGL